MSTVNVAIIGATGYTGQEIAWILSGHRKVKILHLTARIEKPLPYAEILPRFSSKIDLSCSPLDLAAIKKSSDVVFTSLPHTISMKCIPELLRKGMKIIDLSADYRLPAELYQANYGQSHTDPAGLTSAVYGLPEFFKSGIKKAHLVANPGCYPTASLLGLGPLIKEKAIEREGVVIDAKSGFTGAGRKAQLSYIFSEVNENFKAYKVDNHAHKAEIAYQAEAIGADKLELVFAPHLLPVNRGILSTIYVSLKEKLSLDDVISLYRNCYREAPFVRIYGPGKLPELKDVVRTNFCDIGFALTGKRLVIVSVIDNLQKGAAGQAVQNMNILCGFDETEGLLSSM